MKVFVAYDSLSGNTEEMALEIIDALREEGAEVVVHDIGSREQPAGFSDAGLAFIGTYSWDDGNVPVSTGKFMAEHAFTCPVACFGSGEVIWGEEFFCLAVDHLREHYGSPFTGFKQELMPDLVESAELQAWALDIYRTELARKQQDRPATEEPGTQAGLTLP